MKKLLPAIIISVLCLTFPLTGAAKQASPSRIPVACEKITTGMIRFDKNSLKLSESARAQLQNLAGEMKSNPDCVVVVTGYRKGSKKNMTGQQLSWDRTQATITYLAEIMGIDRNRLIFRYGLKGKRGNVVYRAAQSNETGTNCPAPPFPNLNDK